MGEAWGERRAGGSGNAVREDLHRETAGNRGSVGGATSSIQGVCKGNRVRMGKDQEGGLVAPRVIRETTSGHPGRLAGG